MNTLLENLNLVPIEEYRENMKEGLEIMRNIDVKDTQFIALVLKN